MPDALKKIGRIKLPDTRLSVNHKVVVTMAEGGEMDAYLVIGFYPNKQPGEIFIKVAKEGSFLGGAVSVAAIGVSMLLQMGMSLDESMGKWKEKQFNQASLYHQLAASAEKCVRDYGGNPDEWHGYEEQPVWDHPTLFEEVE